MQPAVMGPFRLLPYCLSGNHLLMLPVTGVPASFTPHGLLCRPIVELPAHLAWTPCLEVFALLCMPTGKCVGVEVEVHVGLIYMCALESTEQNL